MNREELLLGQVLTLLANVYRGENKPAYRLEQFVWDPTGMDPAEQRRFVAEGYNKMYTALAKRRLEKFAETGEWKDNWGPRPEPKSDA